MSFGDWFCEQVENLGSAIDENVCSFGRCIERRGDAFFGCEEYEDTDAVDRISGFLGLHDNGTFKKAKVKEDCGIEFGDVVAVSRGGYDHYGIYVNDDEVISYTSRDADIGDNTIQATSLSRFLRGETDFCALVFPDQHGKPRKVNFTAPSSIVGGGLNYLDFQRLAKECNYRLYEPQQTVKRARQKIGENSYNLIFNNCEHFAIWCKTGVKESHQVNRLMSIVTRTYN